MMTILAMTITDPEEVLEPNLWSLDAWHQNIAVLIDLVGIGWYVPNSRSKCILCDNIFLYISPSIKSL